MNYFKDRKYARPYSNKKIAEEEAVVNLSATAAAGILAFTFLNGLLAGFMLKKALE
ncbi:MAG: hypothetical protein QHH06_00360 [Clostridiales bacterium]|nr:hypothetical protein [Eubacteriales bacterium]MDH7564923.1 hypothetical protein [Clostridiales bacterium]